MYTCTKFDQHRTKSTGDISRISFAVICVIPDFTIWTSPHQKCLRECADSERPHSLIRAFTVPIFRIFEGTFPFDSSPMYPHTEFDQPNQNFRFFHTVFLSVKFRKFTLSV